LACVPRKNAVMEQNTICARSRVCPYHANKCDFVRRRPHAWPEPSAKLVVAKCGSTLATEPIPSESVLAPVTATTSRKTHGTTMLRTRSGLPRYCGWNVDRHGTRRVRFRKGGFSTYLSGIPWAEDFMRQYAAALEGVKLATNNVGANSRTIPGSLNALIVSWYRTDFRMLKPSTQRLWRNIIERFRSEHGDKPVARLQRK